MPDSDENFDTDNDPVVGCDLPPEEFDHDFRYLSKQVSPDFREEVKAVCPFPFTRTPDADFCLRLLQYLLFPSLFHQGMTHNAQPRIVVPCRTLAVLDGTAWTSNYRAIDRLRLFEAQTRIPLNVGPWNFRRGLARTVWPEWPPALLAAREAELNRCAQSHRRIYFDTAEPCGRSRRAVQERLDYEILRRQQALLVAKDHPQRRLLELLNSQSNIALGKVVRRNLPATRDYVFGMPYETAEQKLSRDWAIAVLDAVSLECGMVYRAVDKTARVYAIGATLHQLPRHARKLLLAGSITLDLKAAQLAIAARVWDVPDLRERLQGPDNYWRVMLEEVGLTAEHKPALKTATYALLFGKSLRGRRKESGEVSGVVHALANDLGGDATALAAAERFARHPVTVSLTSARKRRMQRVEEEGGLTTVYGKRILVPSEPGVLPGTSRFQAELRSALAEELQAYEQKLMQPALNVIAKRRGTTVLSYLHDGLTLNFEDKVKQRTTVARIIREVGLQAEALGIATSMEEEREESTINS